MISCIYESKTKQFAVVDKKKLHDASVDAEASIAYLNSLQDYKSLEEVIAYQLKFPEYQSPGKYIYKLKKEMADSSENSLENFQDQLVNMAI